MRKYLYALLFWWNEKRASSHMRRAAERRKMAALYLLMANIQPRGRQQPQVSDDFIYIICGHGQGEETKMWPGWFTKQGFAEYLSQATDEEVTINAAITISDFRMQAVKQIIAREKERENDEG